MKNRVRRSRPAQMQIEGASEIVRRTLSLAACIMQSVRSLTEVLNHEQGQAEQQLASQYKAAAARRYTRQ